VQPPYQLTPRIVSLLTRLERQLGRADILGTVGAVSVELRRENRIRTIQSTTAIEGNTLPVSAVTALLAGKRVVGSKREIAEVLNAQTAYELVPKLRPHRVTDLLRAHATLMHGLADDAGRFRKGGVGVVSGTQVVHMAPPAKRVPALVEDLFAWAQDDKQTVPLVKACVVHYELEFIHPFSDGNGRIGRLWQHVLLCAYDSVFAHVPTESLVKQHQQAYYDALAHSNKKGECSAFIEYMLTHLDTALEELIGSTAPARQHAQSRLEAARAHFGTREFSRKDYRMLHPAVSAATASRDLRHGVSERLLRAQGTKAMARYRFA